MSDSSMTSDVAMSLAGRDRGRIFFVTQVAQGRATLTDGKLRRIEHPKSKSLKHLRFLEHGHLETACKIKDGIMVSNREIRKALAVFKAGHNDQGGEMLG